MDFLTWFLIFVVLPVSVGVASYVYLQSGVSSKKQDIARWKALEALKDSIEQMDRNPQGITDFQPGDLIGLAAFGKTREFLLVTHVVKVEYIQVVQTQSLEDYGEEAYPTRNACALLKQLGASLIRDGVEVISYKNYPYRERGL